MSGITHNKVVTGTDDPAFQVSKDAWNAAHDIADNSIALAKLLTEVQNLINGALQKSGGTMSGNLVMGEGTRINGLSSLSFDVDGDNYVYIAPDGILTIGLRPWSTNAYHLGTSDYKWKNLYLSGNIVIDGTVDGVDVSTHAGNADAHHASGNVKDYTLGVKTGIKAGTNVTITDDGGYAKIAASGGGGTLTLLQAMGTTDVSCGVLYPTYEDMPGMSLNFELSAEKTVLIMFSACSCLYSLYEMTSPFMYLKLLVDGTCVTGEGGSVTGFYNYYTLEESETYLPASFALVKTLSAGSHNVKVQWSVIGDGSITLDNSPSSLPETHHRRLIIQYL